MLPIVIVILVEGRKQHLNLICVYIQFPLEKTEEGEPTTEEVKTVNPQVVVIEDMIQFC